MNKLFTCLFGSSLYGTRLPTSDRDVKHIVLPDLDDLLIGKKIGNVFNKTNTKENTRNTAEDVDEEFIPIQVFAKDFMKGQTYALELAYALHGNHAEQMIFDPRGPVDLKGLVHIRNRNFEDYDEAGAYIVDFVNELKTHFLTSNIKAMMGYVVNQASLYSFKGERLNVSRDFAVILNDALGIFQTDQQHYSIADLFDPVIDSQFGFLNKVAELQDKYPKYFKITEYDIGGGRMKPCFTLLEKTFPFTNKIEHSLTVVNTLINKYGDRADEASKANQTVDWKATMHAVRIVDEGLELLSVRRLSFPFSSKQVERYLSIRRGEVPIAEVTQELSSKLDRLKELELTTTLPAYDQEMQARFDVWLASWMKRFYKLY